MKATLTFLCSLFFTMGLFAKDTEEATFWKWFSSNQSRFEHFERDQEELMDELGSSLEAYKKGIVFEVGAVKEDSRDLVISADGIEDLFPAVSKLVAAAPKLAGWKIVAFRPRMEDYSRFSLEYGGRKFDPKEIWFYSRIKDGGFDVIFYHPAYRSEDRNLIISGTYILLDMALGEYDVVTGIRHLDHQLLPSDPKAEQLKPFSEFRAAFDDFKKQKRANKRPEGTEGKCPPSKHSQPPSVPHP